MQISHFLIKFVQKLDHFRKSLTDPLIIFLYSTMNVRKKLVNFKNDMVKSGKNNHLQKVCKMTIK